MKKPRVRYTKQTYREVFLKSDWWKQQNYIWKNVFLNDNKCGICQVRESYCLHHLKYTRRTLGQRAYNADISYKKWRCFVPVCLICHKQIHTLADSKSWSIVRATKSVKKQYKTPKFYWIRPQCKPVPVL